MSPAQTRRPGWPGAGPNPAAEWTPGPRSAGSRTAEDLIGRLIETFVVAQLLPLVGEPTPGSVLSHLRERADGRGIDLIIERRDGTLVAIEIKASSQPTQAEASHLAWIRDRLGPDFAAGWVLHTGSVDMPLGDHLRAAPISSVWADPSGQPAASAR